ncbi:MAG TPA: GDSL-type esterase/lipase family protein [Patescibacteria group bacterium]|nr:GDSL-type esterase/lipase family protein [Patescibacteria group bacterium]
MKYLFPLFILICILSVSGYILVSLNKQHSVIGDKSIYWSNEWVVKKTKETLEKHTIFSGSELDFDFVNVSEFRITGTTTNTDDDASVVIYRDGKEFPTKVDDLKKGKVVLGDTDNKKHSFRLIFYCRGYNPCNFTLTNLTARGGKILQPSGPMKTLGVLGDSISLLYAQDNYSSILSRNIFYHLHNASVWGRDLSHAGKTAPAVRLFEKSLLPYKPNIVLISLGTNDVLDSVSEEDFINDFKKIIDRTAEALPNAKIVVLSILPGKTHQLEKTTKQWDADMQQLLSDTVYFVDATDLLTPADYLDAIHPNVSGQEKIANFLTKSLVAHKLL